MKMMQPLQSKEGMDSAVEVLDRVIAAEVAALDEARLSVRSVFPQAVEMLVNCHGKVVVTGLGKSGIIGRKIAATLASTGRPAFFLNAADALHGDLGMVGSGDVVLMLSNSASTRELQSMLPSLRRMGVATLGIFGRTDTELATNVDLVLHARIPSEGCPLELAPMSSSTVALVIGDALAACLMERRGFSPEDYAVFHPGGQLGRRLLLTAADVMHKGDAIPSVGEEVLLRDMVTELTRTNLGAVCVVDRDGVLAGIVSDGDIRRALMRDNPFALSATDLMTPQPVTVAPETRLDQVLAVMENPDQRIYIVPVIDSERKIAGMVRMHDIIQ